MIRRRSFLIGCGGIVAAPVFAHLALPSPAARDTPVSTAIGDVAGPQIAALRIAGWDDISDSGHDAWVHINSSWRATWR